ncbi:hypothetical protein NQZ68_021066 [Dissostichus eleginoides]|nr:hypothetical protein NQZ68_021066 [Dissostichus eleginoides]
MGVTAVAPIEIFDYKDVLTGLTEDMRQPLLLLRLSLAVLLSANVLAQQPVEIQFQTDPVLVQTGSEIVFTVLTVSQVFSMKWQFQGGVTVGQWSSGASAINLGTQFVGRVTIYANQLRITGAQLRDAGDYTVEVTPSGTTDFIVNSKPVQLRVFDAVAGVNLIVPPVAVEGRNVSLRCTWTAGTDITVQWGKGGAAIVTNARITISGGFLVINPARRSDAGDYSCTVSNPVSAQTTTQSVTVYYGPDTPVLTKESAKECVWGGDVLVGQEVRLTCLSDSLPPALFSWQRDGQTVATGQPDSGVLNLQTFSTDESGRYVCTARNSITGGSSEQGTDLAIVATCLNVGEVVGIVIGCLLLLLILIVLIVFLLRRRRAQRPSDSAVLVQRDYPNPRLITGGAQGGNQQPGVHLSLNTLPQSAQQNNNAQMPTIHKQITKISLDLSRLDTHTITVITLSSETPTHRRTSGSQIPLAGLKETLGISSEGPQRIPAAGIKEDRHLLSTPLTQTTPTILPYQRQEHPADLSLDSRAKTLNGAELHQDEKHHQRTDGHRAILLIIEAQTLAV